MKRKLLLAAMAALMATGIVPITSAGADSPSDETGFVARINSLRAAKGIPALEVDAGLTAKARAWAQTMADKGTIWHSSLTDGITANWRKLGENVGVGGSVEGLHTAFVNSPKHYDNLVDPSFRLIGIGVVRGADRLFVAQEFMQLQGPAATAPVTAIAAKAPVVKVAVKTQLPATKPAAAAIKPTTPAVEPPQAPLAAAVDQAAEADDLYGPRRESPLSGDGLPSIW
jgi:hypothetical protein